jgi:hypothetical protein
MDSISDWNFLSGIYAESTLYMLLVTTLMTILLSTLLAFTYDKTTPATGRSYGFIQALFLMSIVTATIMQSIGDSLAFSFGVFGALAIIRFRSIFTNLRDVAFIFATMAVGIACGVHSFLNGTVGTITFCILVFLLKISPFDQQYNLKGHIRVETDGNPQLLGTIERILQKYCSHITVSRYRMVSPPRPAAPSPAAPPGQEPPTPAVAAVAAYLPDEFEFSFLVKDIRAGHHLQEDLKHISGTKLLRVIFEDKDSSSNT